MSPAVDTAEARAGQPIPQTPAVIHRRVTEVKTENARVSVRCHDGFHLSITRLAGSHLKRGDEVAAAQAADSGPADEVFIHKPNASGSDIYHARIGYAAQPKPDRRSEIFVRAEVVGSQLGISGIHIPCHAIRDYFFSADRSLPWRAQPPLYRLLYTTFDSTLADLRMAYRVRRMELELANASKSEFATLERAYNVVSDPQLRDVYHQLKSQPDFPAPFPYGGFGKLLVEGERAKDGDVFFSKRILAFLPERPHRKVSFPLSKIDFFADYAILRDQRRRLEVLVDQQLVPLKWDPTWSQWRHLIPGSIEVSADFVRIGRYHRRKGEWRLTECEAALPSRTEVTLPADLQDSILKARRDHSRFGQHFEKIDRLRWHVQRVPVESAELRRMCWGFGLPGDFEITQITWRPDYDPYYYQELSKRARRTYLFREEYIFELEKSVVVEVPQAGHATYIFAKSEVVDEFVWQYAEFSREDILSNRNNAAEHLGFLGRVVHGSDKSEWLSNLRKRTGEVERPFLPAIAV
jgi:hypothetical protein